MTSKKLLTFLLVILYVFAFAPRQLDAKTVNSHVIIVSKRDGKFTSIAKAIESAHNGATILVKAGTYKERLRIKKSVKLIGEGNPVIDGGGKGNVVELVGGNTTLQGFIIANGGTDLDQECTTIYVNSNGNRILNNRVKANAFGIYLLDANHNQVEGNIVTGNKAMNEEKRGNGIHLWNSEYNAIRKNTVRYTRDGMYFSFAHHNDISFNELADQRYGVHYMYSNYNVLKENIIRGNKVGASLMLSKKNKVIGNRSSYNKTHGILFRDFDDNILTKNVLTYNQQGMFLYNSQFNKISENYIGENKRGVHITAGSENNQFWHNSFAQNAQQVEHPDAMQNSWDNGREGNYWSDYSGQDLDGNGIGDLSYWPNELVERLVTEFPMIKLLYNSPILQALEAAQKSFPILRPNSIEDQYPLMAPIADQRSN